MKFNIEPEAQYISRSSDFLNHARNLCGEERALAMDTALSQDTNFHSLLLGCELGGRLGFLGYPMLQSLAQNALISAGVETLADEMCRKFAVLSSICDEIGNCDQKTENKAENSGKSEKSSEISLKFGFSEAEQIRQLSNDLEQYEIRRLFREAAAKIGYYGGCLLFVDNQTKPEALKYPLILDPVTFPKGSLRSFVLVDPVNVYPGSYNSVNPLRADYFVPQTWQVMGQEVHSSRLLYFSGQEAPLLFKPSYNFFGIPLAQLAWDYVLHFTQSREAAARLLTKFSLVAFKTNMSDALSGFGIGSLESRIRYFTEKQNNDGVFVIDKESEDLLKLDSSLSGVTEIVRQALELVATVFRIPAVKYLGISPSGFNSTGESDIRNFYDYCASEQAKLLSPNLKKVTDILQMNRYGGINPNIRHSWLSLS